MEQIKHCDYCFKRTEYVDSSEVYGKSYGMIYLCRPCQAWVGVHKGTHRPLGRLADKELRDAKKEAHANFDRIWKEKWMTRRKAYRFLANEFGLKEIHIGESDLATCKQISHISIAIYNSLANLGSEARNNS